LLSRLLEAAWRGTRHYARQREFHEAAALRVPFRELGLAIGLSALSFVAETIEAAPAYFAHRSDLRSLLEALEPYAALGPALASFWLDPENRRAHTWLGHLDINEVMLASALAPDGVLTLRAPKSE
jgi:hypothetical protein